MKEYALNDQKNCLIIGSPRPGGYAIRAAMAAVERGWNVQFGGGHRRLFDRALRENRFSPTEKAFLDERGIKPETIFHCNVTDREQIADTLRNAFSDPIDYLVYTAAYGNREVIEGRASDLDLASARDVTCEGFFLVLGVGVAEGVWAENLSSVFYLFEADQEVTDQYPLHFAKTELKKRAFEMARSVAPWRINAISTGPVRTQSARSIPGINAAIEHWNKRAPLGWLNEEGDEERVLTAIGEGTVNLLAMPCTTGQILYVNGGYGQV